MKVKLYASGGCGLKAKSSKCNSIRSGYAEEMQRGIDISVIAFRWDQDTEEEEFLTKLDLLITQAKAASKKVIVLAQPPILNFSPPKFENCRRLGFSCNKPATAINELYPIYNDVFKQRVTDLGVEFFDPYSAVEDINQLYDGDKLLYSDTDHLSVYGGRWLYEQLARQEIDLLNF